MFEALPILKKPKLKTHSPTFHSNSLIPIHASTTCTLTYVLTKITNRYFSGFTLLILSEYSKLLTILIAMA